MDLILVSQSPRRRELLSKMGYSFDVIVAQSDEKIDPKWSIEDTPQNLALHKAKEVKEKVQGEKIIIGCDTIVTIDDEILGKPKDRQDARRMLKKLNGREHCVISGLCVITPEKTYLTREISYVRFKNITESDIEEYISTGEPMDKAGGYGIQGIASKYIEGYRGSYNNIVGLPTEKLKEILLDIKIRGF